MLRTTVLLVAASLAFAACSSSHPKAVAPPTPAASITAMRRAMPTLTSAQFQQLVTLGQTMCAADKAGFAVSEAVLADQGTTDVGRQIVHFMCPSRTAEYVALPKGNAP